MRTVFVGLSVLLSVCRGFVPSTPAFARSSTGLSMAQQSEVSRLDFLKQVASGVAATTLSTLGPLSAPANAEGDAVTLPSGVSYTVTKSGDGPKPSIGELAAIRFASYNGSIKIDDIFETPEPYYTRIGSGGLLKGVEEVLPKMRVGDRWFLTIPGKLAFGSKGRPASAGKPRIPADATITFDVEMVGLPGKEPELIDLIGDD